MQVESKNLTKRFLIFILLLLINTVPPLIRPPLPTGAYLISNFQGAALLEGSAEGLRVPFIISCCEFLKSVILKTFNEIVLAFLSVKRKTNILYVNINFTVNFTFRIR